MLLGSVTCCYGVFYVARARKLVNSNLWLLNWTL